MHKEFFKIMVIVLGGGLLYKMFGGILPNLTGTPTTTTTTTTTPTSIL